MRIVLFLVIVVFAGTGGELAATHAMKQTAEVKSFAPRVVLGALGQAFRQPSMWLGIALMALGFFSLLALLSWENVSFVVPVTAVSYVVGAVGAKLFLGERLSPARWAGIVLVSIGVALVWVG
jgi:multidrug transporter EmrE-like cation transporter